MVWYVVITYLLHSFSHQRHCIDVFTAIADCSAAPSIDATSATPAGSFPVELRTLY